jgi:hypothetical protein
MINFDLFRLRSGSEEILKVARIDYLIKYVIFLNIE